VNACDNTGIALNGLADDAYATTDSVLAATAATLFFQPDGRVTIDAAGTTAARTWIDITGVVDGQPKTFRRINVEGTTGYVE
jgi:MSHA pilin protein MshC